MPMVAEMLHRLTNKPIDQSMSPDEAVAHGAALYAAMLMRKRDGAENGGAGFELVNVNSHSLGIVGRDVKTNRLVNNVVIPKNTALPHRSKWIRCQTQKANQQSVVVPVVEGESQRPQQCIALGTCVVRDLPTELAAGSDVYVQYRYEANGLIRVSAKLPDARREATVEIKREEMQNTETLAVWKKRLTGVEPSREESAVISNAPKPSAEADSGDLRKRLDSLYLEIGQVAAGRDVPAILKRNQQMILASQQKLQTIQKQVDSADRQATEAASSAEQIRFSAEAARVRSEAQNVRKQLDFAYLILGRECLNQGVAVEGVSAQRSEAEALRAQLESS